MKKIFIDIDVILVSVSGNAVEDIIFEKDVIHTLYRISKQLNYELILVVKNKKTRVLIKAVEMLKSESIVFKIQDNIEMTGRNQQHINKENFKSWDDVYKDLKSSSRKMIHSRNTNETKIEIELNLDGNGTYNVSTGLNFFNHMIEQLSKHSLIDLNLKVDGDLHIDEHHTIEDTAIALGESILKALGNKRGIERYGFLLPMDDCLAQVAIDFGGRSWLVWDVNFKREYVGDVPTEMFYHFFKSFSDAAKCNLNIKAEGENEHHKIESIFKAFAKSIKMAVAVNENNDAIPTTKGIL
ncbi:MAG: imidazoleglycerol-phosphate dehydratase HisB [Parafilimonas sp.]